MKNKDLKRLNRRKYKDDTTDSAGMYGSVHRGFRGA